MTRAAAILVLLLATAALAVTPGQRGNVLLVDGKPTAITCARGCDDVDDLPAYQKLGFNTLLVRMDSPAPAKVEHAAALVAAADKAGLYVLVELAPGNWTMGKRANLYDPDYAEGVAYFLDEVMPAVKDSPNLLGWIIDTVHEGDLVSDVLNFPDFLRAKYGTVQNLNNAWSTKQANSSEDTRIFRAKVPAFNALSVQNAVAFDSGKAEIRKLIVADIQEYQGSIAARDADFQRYLKTRYPSITQLDRDWGFQFETWDAVKVDTLLKRQAQIAGSSPLSLLEYARYQAMVPRGLMEWWTTQLKLRDARGLVFAGGQHSYRTLINLPPCVNGAVTACYPGMAEPDLEHNNPHAIDIARRGNRFIVLAGIPAATVESARATLYLYEAALHGAAGVAVDDWAATQRSPDASAGMQAALVDLEQRRLLNRVPMTHIAFVYSPYPLGPPTADHPLYGYLAGYRHFGPGMTYFTARNGTCYGQFDYLAPEDLPAVPLARYRTLVLASVLDFPDEAQTALAAFVHGGGTALADLSLGMVQMNGVDHFLPPQMQELFGVINVPGVRTVRLNLEVYRGEARFPLLLQGLRSTGINNGVTIGQITRALPMAGTDLLFSTTESRRLQPPVPRPYRPLEQKPTTGVFMRRQGDGLALYATFPLYQFWISGAQLFDEFHRGLCGWGAPVELERPVDFLPSMASVAVFTDGVAAWTRDGTIPQLRITNLARMAFTTAAGSCVISPERTTITFTAPGYHVVEALPITIEPTTFPVRFSASQVNEQGLIFDLGAPDANANTPIVVHVRGGVFPIAPNARQAVTIVTGAGSRDITATADAQGVLTLYLPAARCRVLLGGSDTVVDQPPLDDGAVIDAIPTDL